MKIPKRQPIEWLAAIVNIGRAIWFIVTWIADRF